MLKIKRACFAFLICCFSVSEAFSESAVIELPAITIEASRPPDSASGREISPAEITAIPEQLEPADALRTVPGLLISQHSGAGKANEYFLLNRWLHADLDMNFAEAKFRDTGGAVPLAVNQYVSGGLTANNGAGWEESLRFRDVGRRWGDEDRTVPIEGYAVVDASAAYRRGRWGIQLVVDNIADTAWRDGQFVYLSQLKSDPAPVTDVDFTPGNPRTLLGSVKYYF